MGLCHVSSTARSTMPATSRLTIPCMTVNHRSHQLLKQPASSQLVSLEHTPVMPCRPVQTRSSWKQMQTLVLMQMEPRDESEEAPSDGLPWAGSDRDYVYEELLGAQHLQRTCITFQRSCTCICQMSTQVVLALICGLHHGCPKFSHLFLA